MRYRLVYIMRSSIGILTHHAGFESGADAHETRRLIRSGAQATDLVFCSNVIDTEDPNASEHAPEPRPGDSGYSTMKHWKWLVQEGRTQEGYSAWLDRQRAEAYLEDEAEGQWGPGPEEPPTSKLLSLRLPRGDIEFVRGVLEDFTQLTQYPEKGEQAQHIIMEIVEQLTR